MQDDLEEEYEFSGNPIKSVIFAKNKDEALEIFRKTHDTGRELNIIRIESYRMHRNKDGGQFTIFYKVEKDKKSEPEELKQGYISKCLWCGVNIQQRPRGRRKKYCSKSHEGKAYYQRKKKRSLK